MNDENIFNQFSLKKKTAVVTGCLGLIGPIWIKALINSGAKVAGIDLPSKKIPEELLKLDKNKLVIYNADILDRKQIKKVFNQIKKDFGIPHILVNNAGIDQPPIAVKNGYLFEDIPLEISSKILDVNVLGSFNMIQVLGGAMIKNKGGSIINIGSMYASVVPDPKNYDHIKTTPPFLKPPMYGASKAALIMLSKYVAVHFGKFGVRSNTLSPGAIFNNQDPKFRKKICNKIPLARMAYDDDLTGPLIFLASDASKYITGENLKVDGGITIL